MKAVRVCEKAAGRGGKVPARALLLVWVPSVVVSPSFVEAPVALAVAAACATVVCVSTVRER